MNCIQERLFALQDREYAEFQSKLTPNVKKDLFIGVRVPDCRNLAKDIYKNEPEKAIEFISKIPHQYYDENMLHGLILSEIKDFGQCLKAVEAFLPYVDNWAVCDIMSPKCFGKHKKELLPVLKKWIGSKKEYTIRFGIEMLMSHYLDEDFNKEYLDIVSKVRSDKYYVNMVIAWYFATALAKQWKDTIPYIENKKLDTWVHNKTIQKARESYRITTEQKQYLFHLKTSFWY